MKQLKLMSLVMLMSASIYGADNEIYVDQSGATANIDLEQLGSGNIMGGLNSVAGTLTALDLDGLNLKGFTTSVPVVFCLPPLIRFLIALTPYPTNLLDIIFDHS